MFKGSGLTLLLSSVCSSGRKSCQAEDGGGKLTTHPPKGSYPAPMLGYLVLCTTDPNNKAIYLKRVGLDVELHLRRA